MYSFPVFADGAHLCVFSTCTHTVAQSYLKCPLINVALTVNVYECCLIVPNTATILFVNVPLGSNGDTHQSMESPVSFSKSYSFKGGMCAMEYSANRIYDVVIKYEINN